MPKVKKQQRVLVGLSGGVDSAVSAYLLIKAGYKVEGVFMKNWSSTKGLILEACPWLQDRQEALRVAAFLRIPLHTVDFEKQYEERVLDYFFTEYQAGRTPNPDVMCNKEIKFKLLYEWAKEKGFDYLATGHYAQVKKDSFGAVGLFKSADNFKDQTYFIYNINQSQLSSVLFPVGAMKKEAVKRLAKKIGLPNAERKESMGLCFVGKIRLKDFLEQKVKAKPGSIITTRGEVVGKHNGLHTYTIGQRQGIKVASDVPYYVVKKDLKKNQLVVTKNPDDAELFSQSVQLHSLHWIHAQPFPVKLQARFRHQGSLQEAVVDAESIVTFKKPQKALASGQSVVFYKGSECLGGGVIA